MLNELAPIEMRVRELNAQSKNFLDMVERLKHYVDQSPPDEKYNVKDLYIVELNRSIQSINELSSKLQHKFLYSL